MGKQVENSTDHSFSFTCQDQDSRRRSLATSQEETKADSSGRSRELCKKLEKLESFL